MSEPLTQWLPNVGFGLGEITYNDANTTYDSSLTHYNGAAYAIGPIGSSITTQWSDAEANVPQKTRWSALETTPQRTLWS